MSVVEKAVRKHLLTNKKILVACSGGLDSTVLLEACVAVGLKPEIIHINYQLRGKESDLDEQAVRHLAHKHGLKLRVETCPTEITKGKGLNLQLAARNFRKQFFSQFVATSDKHVVLLAQHRDDQIETFFLQLIRGAGLWGLGGMHESQNGIIRPFLQLSKTELQHYANSKHITWREDGSNSELIYKRNLFRNALIPYLKKSNPTLESAILVLQEAFRNEQHNIAQRLEKPLKKWIHDGEIPFSDWNNLSLEEQIALCKAMNWPTSLPARITNLESAPLSARINDTEIFRTKNGFSWLSACPFNQIWEFKHDTVGFLPKTFSLTEYFSSEPWDESRMVFEAATSSDYFRKKGVNGKTKIFKLLKDAGVPEQWRSTYPILFIDNEAVWVPNIAISSRNQFQPDQKEFLRIQLIIPKYFS